MIDLARGRRVAGGDINQAYRVPLGDGRDAFVKTRADAPPGEYAAEAAALEWIAEPGTIRVPEVLEVSDEYLALEWVEPGRLDAAGEEELGRGLAAVHRAGAPAFGAFRDGADELRIASLTFDVTPAGDWPALLRRAADPAARGRAARRAAAAPSSACASGSPTSPARPSRRRGCTATSGPATCSGTPPAGRG